MIGSYIHKRSTASFWRKIKKWLFLRLRLTNSHTIKLYDGFGNVNQCSINGHVFLLSPLTRRKYRQGFLFNSLALIRLFIVKPMPDAWVQLEWEHTIFETRTQKDGFFKFEWKLTKEMEPGIYPVKVKLINSENGFVKSTAEANLFIPFTNQFTFISDIDDTFLISHSSNLLRRLFVLLTKNAHSRKPFDGVAQHYKLLQTAGTTELYPNPFFYVSSSEWNLYNYIKTFCAKHGMPAGTFLLNQIKTFGQLLQTGQNNHNGKFFRIARILETYPDQEFILLGDDSQEDPNIYAGLVAHFSKKIYCVYIRCVGKQKKAATEKTLQSIIQSKVHCLYFEHSKDAIAHSRQIGLIV